MRGKHFVLAQGHLLWVSHTTNVAPPKPPASCKNAERQGLRRPHKANVAAGRGPVEPSQSAEATPCSLWDIMKPAEKETAGRARKEPCVELSAPHNASVFLTSSVNG